MKERRIYKIMPRTNLISFDKRSTARVVANLNKAIKKIEGRTQDGLIEAGLYIKAQSLRLTPIKLGNLRASAFVTWAGANVPAYNFTGVGAADFAIDHVDALQVVQSMRRYTKDPWVAIGYSAYYAIYVHEMNKNYTEGHWKFLSTAIQQNKKTILKIIAKRARV